MPDPSDDEGGKPGRPLFAVAEERDMVAWLTRCAALGLVITREMFVEEVQRIVQLEQRSITSGGMLDTWLAGFRSRHAAELGPGSLLPERAAIERETRRPPLKWYRAVSAALAQRRDSDEPEPFADPRRVLYLGEANLRLDPRTGTVASLRSAPPTGRLAANENLAYVQAVSASGEQAPPMLALPAGELIRDDLVAGDICFRQTTSNGCVTPTALIQYMVKSLEPYLTAGAVPRPVLIYVDGLQHHGSMTLTQFCDDEGIVMVGLPPGGQARNPLQQSVTSLLAANFDRVVAESRLGRRRNGPGGILTMSLKYLLAGVRQACRRVCKETVAQAFTSSNLFPWGETVAAACEPVDGPAFPVTPDSSPVANGTPRQPAVSNGRSAGASRTLMICQPDITIKEERPSPPPSPPAAARDDPADGSDGDQADDAEPGQLELPQARLAEYLTALDAAREALITQRCVEQASFVMELKDKLRALYAASSAPASDSGEPAGDQLVLPEARLTQYLAALDAAGNELSTQRNVKQMEFVVELKDKLRALHAASSAQSADCGEPAPATSPSKTTATTAATTATDSNIKEPTCAVPFCTGEPGKVRLFRFPKDRDVAAIWLERCRLPPLTRVTQQLAVCSLHFTALDMLPGPAQPHKQKEPRRLRPTAVPNRKLYWAPVVVGAGRTPPPPRQTPTPRKPPPPPRQSPAVRPRPVTASPQLVSPPSAYEGRSARGIKRPKRFDDFQCVDDAGPLRTPPAEAAAASPSAEYSPAAPAPAPAPASSTKPTTLIVTAPAPAPAVASAAASAAASPDMTELANKPPAALKSIIRILRAENAQLRSQLETEQGRGRSLAGALERLARDYQSGAPL